MARTMLGDVREWLDMTVWGYINGINDCGYELMTRAEWMEYIMQTLDMDAQSGQRVNGLDFKHIYFCGKAKIEKLAAEYLSRPEFEEYII